MIAGPSALFYFSDRKPLKFTFVDIPEKKNATVAIDFTVYQDKVSEKIRAAFQH